VNEDEDMGSRDRPVANYGRIRKDKLVISQDDNIRPWGEVGEVDGRCGR